MAAHAPHVNPAGDDHLNNNRRTPSEHALLAFGGKTRRSNVAIYRWDFGFFSDGENFRKRHVAVSVSITLGTGRASARRASPQPTWFRHLVLFSMATMKKLQHPKRWCVLFRSSANESIISIGPSTVEKLAWLNPGHHDAGPLGGGPRASPPVAWASLAFWSVNLVFQQPMKRRFEA